MTARVLNLTAAADALAASDLGDKQLSNDPQLIAAYDNHCQQQWDGYQQRMAQAEREAELAALCQWCGPEGSTGPDCGSCPNGPAVAA